MARGEARISLSLYSLHAAIDCGVVLLLPATSRDTLTLGSSDGHLFIRSVARSPLSPSWLTPGLHRNARRCACCRAETCHL